MKLKQKTEFDKDLSPLENLNLQREHQTKRSHRRYIIQKILGVLRLIGLISLGVWGYTTRDTIYAFILDFFTNPKL